MTQAAVQETFNILPFICIGIAISFFFAFFNKNPQKAISSCSTMFAIVFVIGIIMKIVEFISAHSSIFFVTGLSIVFIGCIIYLAHAD